MHKSRRAALASTVAAMLPNYRDYLTRQEAAAAITQHFFPIKPRTLERWPVSTTRVNGKACVLTREVFTEAQRRLDAAARVAG
jgi:hypothetical protein